MRVVTSKTERACGEFRWETTNGNGKYWTINCERVNLCFMFHGNFERIMNLMNITGGTNSTFVDKYFRWVEFNLNKLLWIDHVAQVDTARRRVHTHRHALVARAHIRPRRPHCTRAPSCCRCRWSAIDSRRTSHQLLSERIVLQKSLSNGSVWKGYFDELY